MEHRRAVAVLALLAITIGVATGCGGQRPPSAASDVSEPRPLAYRPDLPLHVEVTDGGRAGVLQLQRVTYRSVDGARVPALFAIPTDQPPLGCLVYQGGLGQTKEQLPELRQGLAALRLATFTIDPRNGGARGSVAQMVAALRTPETLLAMVLDTVADLRVGLDFLERRPECRNGIAYLGTSFGGVVGAILGGEDLRLKAVALTSIGATFKQAMLTGAAVAKGSPEIPVQVPGAAGDPALLAHAVSVLGPYDPAKWVAKIAPRPVMIINGRYDPLVVPGDALAIAAAANAPKTLLYFDGSHNPFAAGPDQRKVEVAIAKFLVSSLGLPAAP